MSDKELFHYVVQYAVGVFTYEEMHNIGIKGFHQYVRKHFIPIPKSELEVGQEYNGHCRNASRATWDGEKFHYKRTKFGCTFDEKINHYEDDNGYDVFVPVKEI